jgi:positive regulator of sigma E activity
VGSGDYGGLCLLNMMMRSSCVLCRSLHGCLSGVMDLEGNNGEGSMFAFVVDWKVGYRGVV